VISFLADFVTAIPEVLFEALIFPVLGVIAVGFVLEGVGRCSRTRPVPRKAPNLPTN